MSDTGFWCTADRGRTYFNLNAGGARAITFLQRIKTTPTDKDNIVNININNRDPNGTLFIIPVVASKAFYLENSLMTSMISTKSIAVTEGNVRIEFSQKKQNGSGPIDDGDPYYYYDVYQGIDAGESAGLYLRDATGFSAITDNLRAGYCVYKTTVTLKNGATWTVPSSVVSRDAATVFANWSHPDAVVVYSNINKTLKVTGGTVIINLAAFSNGFDLEMPGAGFYIFNKNTGKCVYNSNYIPLFVKNTIMFKESAVNTRLAKPMIPLCAMGMGGVKKEKYYQLYDKGFKMFGSEISSGRGSNTQYIFTDGWMLYIPDAEFPMLICDGSQYFS